MVYTQTEFNNFSFPFSTTCYIVATWANGSSATGSGVVVGKNDVLTAAHVIYDGARGGFATTVTVYPGYDSTPLETPYGSYAGRLLNAYTNFDPNNDGLISYGDGSGSGRGGSEIDFAIIGLDRNIGRDVGVMWVDPFTASGTYNITGYPGYYNRNPQIATGYLSEDPTDYYFDLSGFEIRPGNSGGPVWQWWSIHGYVGGVVSSGSNGIGGAAGQLSGSFTDIATWMNGNDYLVGSNGYLIYGNGASETLVGGAGGDQINGWGGYDVIYAGGGDDIVLSSAYFDDADVVYGGAGADRIFGGVAGDYLFGESGADSLYGDGGADWMDGGADADTLTGAGGDDNLTGGAGADRMEGEGGWDTARYDYSGPVGIFLANGGANSGDAAGDTFVSVEVISASWYNDTLEGDSTSNALIGLGGRDFLSGLQGNDFLYGGADSDTLRGGTGGDYQDAGDGYDYVTYDTAGSAVYAYLQWAGYNFGDAAGDTFVGVEGLIGSGFGDVLIGDTGGNAIFGGNGGDWMDGLSGIDYLYGEAGNDALVGGTGNDNLTGGTGVDSFWINAGDLIPGELDTITDFAVGETIYMSRYVAGLTGFQNWYGGALMTVYTTWGGQYWVYASGVTAAQMQAGTQFIL